MRARTVAKKRLLLFSTGMENGIDEEVAGEEELAVGMKEVSAQATTIATKKTKTKRMTKTTQ